MFVLNVQTSIISEVLK